MEESLRMLLIHSFYVGNSEMIYIPCHTGCSFISEWHAHRFSGTVRFSSYGKPHVPLSHSVTSFKPVTWVLKNRFWKGNNIHNECRTVPSTHSRSIACKTTVYVTVAVAIAIGIPFRLGFLCVLRFRLVLFDSSNWIEHTIPIHCVIYLVSSVCSTLNENWFVHFCCVFYYHLCLCFAGWTNFLCWIHCLCLAHGFSSSTECKIFQLGSRFGAN